MKVLLISTYELGRQPFGLASPAAWLREAGHDVACQDLSQERLNPDRVHEAQLICFYLPMHTATRIALAAIHRVRALNSDAHLCCYGLYAPVNADLLRSHGVETILGGEFEEELVALADRLSIAEHGTGRASGRAENNEKQNRVSVPAANAAIPKLHFITPDRAGLPSLSKYARLKLASGEERVVGYTEASRGCRHLCRHCPVVPVYNGAFRIVQRDVVLEDIRRQVAAGAQHITFGDPDFFNGPSHAIAIVETLHHEFPTLSYDVTIKIEHLLKFAEHLPVLRSTGCAFVTTAVESVDDQVLALLEKGHTHTDFVRVVGLMRHAGLPIAPTFIPFTPWTTLESYAELLRTIAELDLTENVAPVQLAIRLLIPSGSRLLEVPEVRDRIGEFDRELLSYRWRNRDARVDELQQDVESAVAQAGREGLTRAGTFDRVWQLANNPQGGWEDGRIANSAPINAYDPVLAARATIPYLTEPWYC